jgi:hypothetical protein
MGQLEQQEEQYNRTNDLIAKPAKRPDAAAKLESDRGLEHQLQAGGSIPRQ